MTTIYRGAWDQQQINAFMARAEYPVRLACHADDGFPRVVSLWYQWRAGQLLCVTHKHSSLAQLLGKNQNVGFEVSPNIPPYQGVRGQGMASLQPLGRQDTLAQLLDHYLGTTDSTLGQWLLNRSEDELLLTVTPVRFFSWDYSSRMSDQPAGQQPKL